MSRLTQIALDFGAEFQAPPPSPRVGETESTVQQPEPMRQYIPAAGVVVRLKTLKNTATQEVQLPPVTASSPVVILPAAGMAEAEVAVREEEPARPLFVNGELFSTEVMEEMKPAEEEQPAAEVVAEVEVVVAEEPVMEEVIVEVPAAVEPLIEEPVVEEPLVPREPIVEEPSALQEPAVAEAPEPVEAAEAPLPPKRRAAPRKAAVKTGPSKRGRKSLKEVSAEADLIEIPNDEVLYSKQYYTMGEVSEMFRVNQSLLRFWETEFKILQPKKNKKGDRYFRPIDIKNLHLIYHLLRQKKYTIEGAKEFLKKNKKAEERFEVIRRLQEIRTFLLEWKAQL
ncbi:MAG TPA: MerR family transcriptional regulator [Puia sp.]